MHLSKWALVCGVLGIACSLQAPASMAQDLNPPPPPQPQNPNPPAQNANAPETLARGPLHEGYAEPMEQEPGPGPAVAKQPPEPIDELPPDQKPAGDHVVWIPGYWAYDADRADFIWVSGFWRALPPGKIWMAGSWRKADEGYQWVPGFWHAAQEEATQVQYLPQPPKPVETGPATPAPNASAIYVPGSWVYRDNRYVWRPGFWTEYRQDWIWVPAHYRWTPAGYVFIDGYWDYSLANRGMLFAPAYVPPGVYMARGYYYQPTVVVRDQCVFGALFVRRGHGCYYFGDYFDARYANGGYVSWCGYRGGSEVVVGWYDPMYSYYSVHYRGDPAWRGGMVELYVGRYRGDVARPPVTLVAQNNIFVNVNVKVNVNNVQMLTTVAAASRANPAMRMEAVSMERRQQHMVAAREIHAAAVHRSQAESKMLAEHGGRMPGPKDPPRAAKVAVAKTMAQHAAATAARTSSNNASSSGVGHGGTPTTGHNPTGTNTGATTTGHNTTGTTTPKTTDPKATVPKSTSKIDPKKTTTKPAPKHDPKEK